MSAVNRYGPIIREFIIHLKLGVSRAIFRSSGIVPVRKVKFNMCESGLEISLAIVLITCEHIPS